VLVNLQVFMHLSPVAASDANYQPNQDMKYSFTIRTSYRAPFTRTSDDRTFEGALLTAKMLEECFPGAIVEINKLTR
jgi:hypothetical protein